MKRYKRPAYWNKYKVIEKKVQIVRANEEERIRKLLDLSYQGAKRLFVLAYDITKADNQVSVDYLKKYFLPRVKIENYNIEIDGRNFYDQPTNDSIKQEYLQDKLMIIQQAVYWILLILKNITD